MDFKIPSFKTDKELFDFLVEKEDDIFWSKKQQLKEADSISFAVPVLKEFGQKAKSTEELLKQDSIEVVSIINTTKVLDSHRDVHIDGLWDKSISENKSIKHIQEHVMKFNMIIADKEDLEVYTKMYNWKDLGYDAVGKTQALTFKSTVRKNRNTYMFEEYAKGRVDQHSVGMRYVKLVTCINDDDYPVQKENWDKYSKEVINAAELERSKYFWAVLEAKCIEGSAVPLGSNFITPTQSVKSIDVEPEIENITKSVYLDWLKN